ncbi:MAG: hypothetical protein JNK04_09560 [Myxococcales bacterium]|nr:hypothetical protein [Myxococcales bacterium]
MPVPLGPAVIRSAAVLLHPWGGYQFDLGFNELFSNAWEESLDAELPGGATRNGSPILTMGGPRSFSLRQNFWVNSTACFERQGHFTLNITLNGPGDVSVGVSDSYVDQADWPEPWDCWTPMKEAMEDGANEAAQRLRDELPSDLTGFAFGQCKSQQYFVPVTPRAFEIVSGGVTYPMSVCQ